MAEIINQIPGYENGSVQYVSATDEVGALFLSAQMVSDILNKWNTNVAFFSLTGRCVALQSLVKNESPIAKIYAVNQKNPNLQVILRKVRGMVNRKFVRAIVIEGLPEQDAGGKRWLEQLAKSTNTSIVVVEVHEEECDRNAYFVDLYLTTKSYAKSSRVNWRARASMSKNYITICPGLQNILGHI